MVVQRQGEGFLIKENINPTIIEVNQLTKTAYAYSENICVDGSQILETDLNEKTDEEFPDYFIVVDESSFLSLNAPTESSIPLISRNTTVSYTVKEGDSPGKIAAQFGISLNTVLSANNLNSKSVIKPGQELVILPVSGVTHKVKSGESLSSIASKYKASIDDIISFNNLKDEKSIQSGQEIIIPGGILASTGSSASTTVKTTSVSSSGLTPMKEDTSSWTCYDDFFAFPVSGGWNKGVLHYYNAVDIISSCGSPIYASADGIVIDAKGSGAYNLGYGNLVKVQHNNGTMTVYAHLSEVLVKAGDKVYQGSLLGRMGDTGNSNGCHLHFEVHGAQNPFVQ